MLVYWAFVWIWMSSLKHGHRAIGRVNIIVISSLIPFFLYLFTLLMWNLHLFKEQFQFWLFYCDYLNNCIVQSHTFFKDDFALENWSIEPSLFFLGNTFPGDYMTIAQFVLCLACYFSLFCEKTWYLKKLRLHNIHVSGHIDNIYAKINFTALYLHFSLCFTSWQRIFFTILELYLRPYFQ